MENKGKKDSKEKEKVISRSSISGQFKKTTSIGPRRSKITDGSSSTGPRKPSK